MTTPKTIPFSVSRNDARTLLAQVADGFRDAIVSGYYVPGDILPSSRELSKRLGVSMIVAAPALKRLADEGFVVSRPRLGTVVRDRDAKRWRGHVVTVHPQGDVGYFSTMFAEEMRFALNRAGYLLTRTTVARAAAAGSFDFSLLDAALARSVDLAVVFDDVPAVFRHLSARGIPYVVVAHRTGAPSGATGFTRFDYEAAAPDFATACRAAGVRSAIVLRWHRLMCDAAPALRAAGIAVKTVSVAPDPAREKFAGVEEAGYRGFRRLAGSGRLSPDVALFVSDDYLARGALLAMAESGLRPPEDFRLAIWSNAGIAPYFPREISRMEADPAAAGAETAAATLAFLESGRYPEGTVIRPRWIAGETMAATPLPSHPSTPTGDKP